MTSAQTIVDELAAALGVWAVTFMVPNAKGDALVSAANRGLPADWAVLSNYLDSGSMNAGVFLTKTESVANGIDEDSPPTDVVVSRHRLTAAVCIPVGDVGTLEAIANTDGFEFGDHHLALMRTVATQLAEL